MSLIKEEYFAYKAEHPSATHPEILRALGMGGEPLPENAVRMVESAPTVDHQRFPNAARVLGEESPPRATVPVITPVHEPFAPSKRVVLSRDWPAVPPSAQPQPSAENKTEFYSFASAPAPLAKSGPVVVAVPAQWLTEADFAYCKRYGIDPKDMAASKASRAVAK